MGVHMSLGGKELDIKVDANTGQVLATDADDDDAFDEEGLKNERPIF